MKTRLSVLKTPRDVHIKKLVVDGRVRNVNERSGTLLMSHVYNKYNLTISAVDDPLNKLYERVAHNAILNASGRADDVRCYPGTREEVMRKIENWKNRKAGCTSRMMWLSGPAGAGKTAIVQTVAEKWKKRGVPAASFFFFRGDSTRNISKPIVATILYQLFRHLPALKKTVADLLSDQPLVLKDSIYDQFAELINAPILTLIQQASPKVQSPIVLLIDGLDECGSDGRDTQEHLLAALQDLIAPEHSPFIVLVASRREPNLIMAFNKLPVSIGSIFLDDGYRPQQDIRHFVAAKFDEIKRTHHLSHSLRHNWPLASDIENITTKSSGQFIYAATVMRFLENSPESPRITLQIIQGIQPAENHSPFAQIDSMYAYIFSQTKYPAAIKKIFALHFISVSYHSDPSFRHQSLFDDLLLATAYDITSVESLLSALSSIVQLEHNADKTELVFFHASLGDFLQDESRSGIHFVDVHAARVQLNIYLVGFGKSEGVSGSTDVCSSS